MKKRKGGDRVKENLNICIDIDGTVTDPYFWVPQCNRFFGRQVQTKDVTQYEIHKVLGVEEKAFDDFYDKFGEEMHRNAAVLPGVTEILNKLYDQNRIHFVTARAENLRTVSLEWLDKYSIPMDSITLLGHPDKADKARSLDCDIFIEDSLRNAKQLAKAGFDVLLVDCNYNKGNLPPNITRVRNWCEIERYIQNYEQAQKQKIAM